MDFIVVAIHKDLHRDVASPCELSGTTNATFCQAEREEPEVVALEYIVDSVWPSADILIHSLEWPLSPWYLPFILNDTTSPGDISNELPDVRYSDRHEL